MSQSLEEMLLMDRFKLQVIEKDQILNLSLLFQGSSTQAATYEANIACLKQIQNAGNYFLSLHELAEYLKDSSNISFDPKLSKLIIMGINPIDKNKKITLFNIIMKSNSKDDRKFLPQLLERCNSKYDLTNEQMRLFIQILGKNVSRILQTQRQLKKQISLNQILVKNIEDKQQNHIKNIKQILQFNRQYFQNSILKLKQQVISNVINLIHKNKQQNFMQNKYNPYKQQQCQTKEKNNYKQIKHSMSNQKQVQMHDKYFDKLQILTSKNIQNVDETIKKQSCKKQKCKQKIQKIQQKIFTIDKRIMNLQKFYISEKSVKFLDKKQKIQKPVKQQKCLKQQSFDYDEKICVKQKIENKQKIKKLQIKDQIKAQIDPQKWVLQDIYYINKISFKDNEITVNDMSYVFGSKSMNDLGTFSIKINKMQNSISVGIIDISYKDKEHLYDFPHRIAYFDNGNCYVGRKRQSMNNGTYSCKDIITVIVNTKQGFVLWKVNGNIRYRLQNPIIKDPTIQWVPYIYLDKKGDSVTVYE